jgi:periplasmic divalent cation tolerance protein
MTTFENEKYCIVYTSAPTLSVSQKIASTLVEDKLAACVSRIPNVASTYRWNNTIQVVSLIHFVIRIIFFLLFSKESEEFILMIKTCKTHVESIITRIQAIHPYELPEIIVVPITRGCPVR